MISPQQNLAELGYAVFPCAGKVPLTPHGCKDATTDSEQIEKWSEQWPHANWAISTNGLLVVDCDPGSESWPPDDEQALDLASAPTVRTPRGGRHFYFRQPDGLTLGNTVQQIAPNVDTRGNAGYVVAPPSSGEQGVYAWVSPIETGPQGLNTPPPWLLALLSGQKPKVPQQPEDVRKIPAGQRNDAMFRFASKMRGAGLTPAEIYGALSARNTERCDPPLLEEEVRRIAKSAGSYPPGKTKGGQGDDDTASRSISVRVSDVVRKPVRWLWPKRIPLGKVTLIAGEPGEGKSTLVTDIAARVTTGAPWPDEPATTNKPANVLMASPGSVLMLSAEDDVEDTIAPRLVAAGADTQRAIVLQGIEYSATGTQRCFNLEQDLPTLERDIQSAGDCKLVIIDPVSSHLGNVDSHKNAEVRSLIAPLAALASSYNIAVLLVTHLSKGQNRKAMHAPTGSIAFIAAARASWLVSIDKQDPERRLLLPIKNNLTKNPSGLAFRIVSKMIDGESVGAVEWEPGRVDMTADTALSDEPDKGPSQVDACGEFLLRYLGDGAKLADDVREAGDAEGYSPATIKRARVRLGIAVNKRGFQGPWEWSIPGQGLWPKGEEAHLSQSL